MGKITSGLILDHASGFFRVAPAQSGRVAAARGIKPKERPQYEYQYEDYPSLLFYLPEMGNYMISVDNKKDAYQYEH
jgi:hypothetical protein